jgi:hypothetical protein
MPLNYLDVSKAFFISGGEAPVLGVRDCSHISIFFADKFHCNGVKKNCTDQKFQKKLFTDAWNSFMRRIAMIYAISSNVTRN